MHELKNMFMMKKFPNKPVVILKILMQNQVFILKCQLLVIEIIVTTTVNLSILWQWIQMLKISIKIIIIHRGQSTRKLMNRISEKLNYFLKILLNTVKNIKNLHKILHLKSKIKEKIIRRKFVFACGHGP